MDSTITHHPKQQLNPSGQLPRTLYTGNGVVWCGTRLWPAQVLDLFFPSSLCRTQETEQSLTEDKYDLRTIKL